MSHQIKVPGGGAFGRSAKREVRNPVLALPAAHAIISLPSSQRLALASILMDLSADAAQRAQAAWRVHKGIMAAYWKAVSVYAKHIARAVRAGAK